MFTGIIQAVGHIHQLTERQGGDARVVIQAGGLELNDVALGDSIACNGVCLTLVEKGPQRFSVDVSAETFRCTLGFVPGESLNLEKALRVGDHLGGHIVSGHVDGVGEVVRFLPVSGQADQEASWQLEIRAPHELAKFMLGLLAPAGTPKPVVAKLNAAMRKVMDNNAVAERFRGLGANPGASSPEEFSARIRDELQQWQKLVKQLNLKFE